ncbi:hypothetical protein [Streptomyces sp. NPDC050738]|uniref:hypothetical protein n=1 Tax=Streptomyces sp. NPDC050738 TaxID=3154744 RepID=UPI003420330F
MSFSMYVQKSEHGESVPMDEALAREILSPHIAAGGGDPVVAVRADDGGVTEVYVDASGLMIHRPERDGIFDITAELIDRLDAVLLIPGGPAVVRSETVREHLPEELQRDAVVIELSGAAILRVLETC